MDKLSRDYKAQPLGKLEKPLKEDLEYLFLEVGMTIADLVQYFGKGKSSVSRWLQGYNIKKGTPQLEYVKLTEAELNSVDIRRLSRDFQKQPWIPHKDIPVKSDFQYLYAELNWSRNAVATYLGISPARVAHIVAELGITKTSEQSNLAKSVEMMRNKELPAKSIKKVIVKKAPSQAAKMRNAMAGEYLTEDSLENYLKVIFPTHTWERNTTYRYNGGWFKPDYICHTLKLVVEFDGMLHYSSAEVILRDKKKDLILRRDGYKVVRIPYFVQMSTEVIKALFKKDKQIDQVFPHGFISNKATAFLPTNFNELGVERFLNDLDRFSFIKEDIINSLKDKILEKGDIRLVLPKSLEYLVK